MEDKKIFEIIKNTEDEGRTITEIVELSHFPRSVVRISLARLEGAGKIKFRKIGMAKVYSINAE